MQTLQKLLRKKKNPRRVRSMARLAMLLTFLVLVASMRAVSTHRTTITTVTIDDEENPGRSWGGTTGCHERVHAYQLHHCRQYLSRGRQILAMRGGVDGQEQQQQHLQECCQQLRQVEEPCRCKGIRKIAKERRQKEQLQGQELREMVQMAQNLPSACRVPPQRCKINVGEY